MSVKPIPKLPVGAFFSWLFSRGGMKRAIFVPFGVLLAVTFVSSWWLYVRGSREALFAVVDGIARSGASRVESELRSFLSVPSTVAGVLSMRLSESDPLGPNLEKNESIDRLPDSLARQLADFPTLDIISVGLQTGEYAEAQRLPDGSIRLGRAGKTTGGALVHYSVSSGGNRTILQREERYDPRGRPWYRNAIDRGAGAWSDPYEYVSTGASAVAATQVIRGGRGSGILGVVSATVSLGSISTLLTSMEELSGGGAAAIVDSGGRVVASVLDGPASSAGRKALLPAAELSAPYGALFGGFPSAGGAAVRQVSVDGKRWRVVAEPADIGALRWSIVVALPESRFLSSLVAAEQRAGGIYVAAFLAALFAAFLIAHGISQPLRTLGAAATAFVERIDHCVDDPRLPHARDLTRLTERQDELGRLAASLAEIRSHLAAAFKRLNSSLAEKDVLLREVHHRVKNNLQIVSSFMSLQESESDDPAFIAAMRMLQDRVRAMAVVHETIYSSGDFVSVLMDDYLERVTESLSAYQGSNIDLTLAVVPGGVKLPLEQAIPCGLIAVELTTNAIKHAFPDRRSGRVELCIRPESDAILLTVADDGVGVSSASDEDAGTGVLIVSALASQLRGSYSIQAKELGTRAEVRFPGPGA